LPVPSYLDTQGTLRIAGLVLPESLPVMSIEQEALRHSYRGQPFAVGEVSQRARASPAHRAQPDDGTLGQGVAVPVGAGFRLSVLLPLRRPGDFSPDRKGEGQAGGQE